MLKFYRFVDINKFGSRKICAKIQFLSEITKYFILYTYFFYQIFARLAKNVYFCNSNIIQ